ncbi:maleylpyruvate isomerase [Mycobacterium sp. OAS707]|uniref:maleylpyruvate isomerase family mycothiol-dependent enzyme n=1 Tax=Mycobacterium sp. OAS707 TaxID=2663822 RepID=UPI00178BA001|nr:maleylpyruvate isomerase family mycothiol-dependent enzyme [Mycobacterium sp. OAS707]MBE1549604.1 maleylpyruvate isomerase [Mycobacterium sp. OAS707]
MSPERGAVEQWLQTETRRLLARVGTFSDCDLTADSSLPDWSLAHLLTHLARNADALGNLLYWARTGIETPMYQSKHQRADDINIGALRPAGVILADVVDSAARLQNAAEQLTTADWDQEIVTAQGRRMPAANVPWLRLREVTIHHVDLGGSFDDLPPDLAVALLDDVVNSTRTKPNWPSLHIEATDTGTVAEIGSGPAVDVKGTHAHVLGWLTGRTAGGELISSSDALPALPAWL